MAWKKIVERLNVRALCPACHAEGFKYQPSANPHDQLEALVECRYCGWKGTLGELDIVPNPPEPK